MDFYWKQTSVNHAFPYVSQIEKDTDEYKLLNPVVSKLDKARKAKQAKLEEQFKQLEVRVSRWTHTLCFSLLPWM